MSLWFTLTRLRAESACCLSACSLLTSALVSRFHVVPQVLVVIPVLKVWYLLSDQKPWPQRHAVWCGRQRFKKLLYLHVWNEIVSCFCKRTTVPAAAVPGTVWITPYVSYSWVTFCTVWLCLHAVYTTTFTRAHRGSLPTPKQIMQLLIEQEKARGSWRAARYLRFISPLV